MKNLLIASCVALASLTGCAGFITIEREGHFYPSDQIAAKTGVLTAHMVGHGELHGTVQLPMPNGELLQGEYSIVADGAVGSGLTLASNGRGFGIGSFGGETMAGSGNGMMVLQGNRGTSLSCEFQNNNLTGHGYGTCQSSTGGHYRVTY
jgi:hypothetical protein